MQIKGLQPRQGKVELIATVIEKSDVRDIATANFSGKICNAKLKDETGTIKFTLWNDQVVQVNVGDTIKVINGYVSEYQGEMQLSTGKFGTLEVVSKGTGKPEVKPEPKKEELSNDYADDAEEEFVE
ncbi:MAG: SOSS complex subunit B family protein [Candidatus Woesearchaeota archaeon]|jgi:replication factor A1